MNKFNWGLMNVVLTVLTQTASVCYADSVTLINGAILEGEIIEVKADSLKIDVVDGGDFINCIMHLSRVEVRDWKKDDRFNNLQRKEVGAEQKAQLMKEFTDRLVKREHIGEQIIFEERQDRRDRTWRHEIWQREDDIADKVYRREKERFEELKVLVLSENLKNKELVGELVRVSGIASSAQGGYQTNSHREVAKDGRNNHEGPCRWDPGNGVPNEPGHGVVRTAGWVFPQCRFDENGTWHCSCERTN